MSIARRTLWLIIAALVAVGLGAGAAQAQQLKLRFEIHPVIDGSRPWDGTGMNSAQMDSGNGGFFGSMMGQIGLDQFNQRIAPPDPYPEWRRSAIYGGGAGFGRIRVDHQDSGHSRASFGKASWPASVAQAAGRRPVAWASIVAVFPAW